MRLSRPTSEGRWSRPPPRQVKVKVDAFFFKDSRSGAVGATLRDYQGLFIAASCKFIPHLTSAMMAEAMAMKEGLSLANSKGCNSVIAEGDSMETIQTCTGSDVWWTEPATIYADCINRSSGF
jgi:ribonuclease HI